MARWARAGFVLAVGILALCQTRPARAQDSVQTQFWPEVDLYYQVTPHWRLYGIATFTVANDTTQDYGQYGINSDFFLDRPHPLQGHRPVDALAFDRSQPLMLRVGYRYGDNFATDGGPVQDRLLAELTGRISKGGVTIADRNGFDFRWIDGEYSSRYRNRIYIEVPVTVGHYAPVPYADAEWFYVFQKGEWTYVRYELGVHLPVAHRVAVEPYGGWETHWDGSPDVRGLGLNLVFSW